MVMAEFWNVFIEIAVLTSLWHRPTVSHLYENHSVVALICLSIVLRIDIGYYYFCLVLETLHWKKEYQCPKNQATTQTFAQLLGKKYL